VEQLRIDTPEQVALEFPVAGIGSRFLAIAVDTLLQGAMYVAIALLFLGGFNLTRLIPASWASFLPAIIVLFLFLLQWGYFVVFEIAWRGQTPGKRAAHIRVIQDSGRPVSAMSVLVRNLLRAVDVLPAFYVTGIVAMMLSRHSRRLGDLAAGTLVVHERPTTVPASSWRNAPDQPVASGPAPRLTPEEIVLIETYLARRFELDPLVQDRAANQIGDRIFARTHLAPAPGQHLDDFLEQIAREARDARQFD
jgi:uncharacterized RDD family membrane protein YckC